MKNRKSFLVILLLLLASIGNYYRISNEANNIRTVEFLSILAIGALSALLIRELVAFFRKHH